MPKGQPVRNGMTRPVSDQPRELGEKQEVKDESKTLIRIFPYGINRTRLERAIREKRAPAFLTNDINQADAVVAMRSTYQSQPRKLRDMAGRPVLTVVVKSNTFSQIADALDQIVKGGGETQDLHTKEIGRAHV